MKINFSYLPDLKNPKRILVLAREMIEMDDYYAFNIGYSINNQPNPKLVEAYEMLPKVSPFISYFSIESDTYNKKEGKRLAIDRMKNNPFKLIVIKGGHVYHEILVGLADKHPVQLVRKIVRQHVNLYNSSVK